MQRNTRRGPHSKPDDELLLPLEYAPAKVIRHGLRDAHVWPLVSHGQLPDGTHGATFRVPAWRAWEYAEIELRAANSWPAMIFDCDGRDGTARKIEAQATGLVRLDNWTTTRRSSGGSHVIFCLARPVHRGEGARTAPLRRYARIAEYYSQVLGADRSYRGVLTHNPMAAAHGRGFKTGWGRHDPYTLDELAEVIPFGWRMPTKPAAISTEAGRNCYLFLACMGWAGSSANLAYAVLPAAIAANAEHFSDHPAGPLSYGDVQALAKSVERYRREWIAQGRFWGKRQAGAMGQGRFTWDSESQTRRGALGGVRSGQVRREGTAGRDAEIVGAVARGESLRAVAMAYGLTHAGVGYIVGRGVK